MPHATNLHDIQDAQDDALIQQALDPQSTLDFSRDLEPGEKADDAIDFGDLSDDDLAEDDVPPTYGHGVPSSGADAFADNFSKTDQLPSDLNSPQDAFEDLFGEDTLTVQEPDKEGIQDVFTSGHVTWRSKKTHDQSLTQPIQLRAQEHPVSSEQQMQQELLALSDAGLGASDTLPEPPANDEELLAALWPKFKRHATPRFMEILPPKKARYIWKQLLKPPRPVNPSKVSLEIAQDQEKGFKISTGHNLHTWDSAERSLDVTIDRAASAEKGGCDEMELDSESDDDNVYGISWRDFQILCEDWATLDVVDKPDAQDTMDIVGGEELYGSLSYNLKASIDHEMGPPSSKKQRIETSPGDILARPPIQIEPLDDPELTTSSISTMITLDLNDAHLLVDKIDSSQPAANPTFESSPGKTFWAEINSKNLGRRYNISNDEAYDLLKENHQHKIRGMLGNLHVEHCLPALRLQWPFYKTRLDKQEARSFHRPSLRVNRHEQISFDKPYFVKKKHIKGKDSRQLFSQSKDLALGDNSNVLMLEYSEEYPTMLSNHGMGNKVVNYYRKRNSEDNVRPKMDIGELLVLLPQDKSPFSLFGHVDPGQVTPAIYNAMYKAPIFKQEVKSTDFLAVRVTTGILGSSWFLRNINHLHIVGQEFPAIDVPGPHSRKVTTASKNRLRMISYRMARREKTHRISVSEVTSHFIDTTDMQNRQKMKEFMQFDKDHKEWKMRPGESIPDEETVRTMVKPEDVCLLESMQVGQQHLQDAGFSKEDDDASEGDDVKEDGNIEQQLAPWFTTRNFLNAAQGKAMLQLHGEGDPSGRGEAFSFIKTSMKGGFRAVGESIAERIDNKKMKDSGGHSYNVARQQQAYEESIRRIWDAQKQSLSSALEQSDSDIDEDDFGETSDGYRHDFTPRSEGRMSGLKRHRDDETESQSTKWSTNSQTGKILEITRIVRDRYGNEESVKDIVRNPRVIRQYLRRRRAQEAANEDLLDIKPGDDDEENKRKEQRLKKELARLERNKDRRIARDKQKGIQTDGALDADGSPPSPGANPARAAGTLRKCANCGQVGHIKTNKKLCPMLNGSMKPDEGFSASAFTTGAPSL